ncbi:MAG TPA: class I SAM-dependent methyltransferase [Actinopolymorphaceae bacterium]
MTPPHPARSFGQSASLYDRVRPTYPVEAVRWALAPAEESADAGRPLRVVDLGAGTGLASRVLRGLGHEILPVEPDPRMREQLEAASPGLCALAGSAESIPLPDASVDAVVVAQAYHWFDKDRAHPEIARVLRTGGVFCPMWNLRDESVDWVADLTVVANLGGDGSRMAAALVDDLGQWFEAPEQHRVRHAVELDAERLVDLVRSRSGYLVSTPEERTATEERVRALVANHPRLAGRQTFELPYITYVHRARRFAEIGR